MIKRKVRKGKMIWFLYAVLIMFTLYFTVQGIRCVYGYNKALDKDRKSVV